MAIGVITELPGGTKEHYEALSAKLAPNDSLPKGASLHIAGPTSDGWRVIGVWESAEVFERFLEKSLKPGVDEVGAPRPRAQQFEVHKLLQR